MLTQLIAGGVLGRAAAIVCGEFPACDEPGGQLTACGVAADLLEAFPGPVLFGFPTGHTTGPALTVPLGGGGAGSGRRTPAARGDRIGGLLSRATGLPGPPSIQMMKVHLIGICGTAMATLAAMLKEGGHDVGGSDQHVYPPMSDFLAARGIPCLDGFEASHVAADVDLVVIGNAVSRGESGSRGGARSRAPVSLAAGDGARDVALGPPVDRRRGHPRQDDDRVPGGVAVDGGRPRPELPDRRRDGDEYDSAFFDKNRKVPEVPSGHCRGGQPRVRPRRRLRRLRGGSRGGPAACDPAAQAWAAARGRRTAPPRSRWARGAPCRVETFGLAAGADWRATGVEPGSGRNRGHGGVSRRADRPGCVCRWSVPSTCGTCWRRSRWPVPSDWRLPTIARGAVGRFTGGSPTVSRSAGASAA